MPTAHRRIAVTCDPELERALRDADAVLGPDRPAASLVRDLALRGAQTLRADAHDDTIARLVREHGAIPARGSLADYLRENPLGPVDSGDPYAATRVLEELRADTV